MGTGPAQPSLKELPLSNWTRFKSIEGEEFDELFRRIYAEMSNWADPARLRTA